MVGHKEDKVALVTEAGHGLGRTCAQILACERARALVVDLKPETGQETVALIRQAGGDAAFCCSKRAILADVQAMVKGSGRYSWGPKLCNQRRRLQ